MKILSRLLLVGNICIYSIILSRNNYVTPNELKTEMIINTELLELEAVNMSESIPAEDDKPKIEIIINDMPISTCAEESIISKQDEMDERIEQIEATNRENWFREYKDIMNDYIQYPEVTSPNTVYDIYTKEEIDIMLSCIETEVYTGDFESKCNVASVILNRVNSNNFPNSPIDVVTDPHQFAHGRTKISESTILALEYVVIFGDTTDGCVAFRSDKCPNVWYGLKYQFTDKVGHNFYK